MNVADAAKATAKGTGRVAKAIGPYALKAAIYLLGHQDVLLQTVADAQSKNLGGLGRDGMQIVAGVGLK